MGGQVESKEQGGQSLRVPTAPVFPAAARLPLVGLGTWTQRKPGEVRDAVEAAIRWAGGGCRRNSGQGLPGARRLSGGFRPAVGQATLMPACQVPLRCQCARAAPRSQDRVLLRSKPASACSLPLPRQDGLPPRRLRRRLPERGGGGRGAGGGDDRRHRAPRGCEQLRCLQAWLGALPVFPVSQCAATAWMGQLSRAGRLLTWGRRHCVHPFP